MKNVLLMLMAVVVASGERDKRSYAHTQAYPIPVSVHTVVRPSNTLPIIEYPESTEIDKQFRNVYSVSVPITHTVTLEQPGHSRQVIYHNPPATNTVYRVPVSQPQVSLPTVYQQQVSHQQVSQTQAVQQHISQGQAYQQHISQSQAIQQHVSQQAVSLPTVAQSQVSLPSVYQPTVYHPTVYQPTVYQPTVYEAPAVYHEPHVYHAPRTVIRRIYPAQPWAYQRYASTWC